MGTVQRSRYGPVQQHLLHPDVAIALMSHSMEHRWIRRCQAWQRVVLSIMDAGIIAHKALLREMEKFAEIRTQHQLRYDDCRRTDADNIHKHMMVS